MKKPSVTKLIEILDKPRLLKWANDIGLRGINMDTYRKQKMNEGTNYHNQISEYVLKGKKFTDNDFYEKFMKFISNKTILEAEKNIETDYFIGRYDIKIIMDGVTYICDFKTNKTNVYFENKLQLIAYKMAEKCDRIAIISLPSFMVIPVKIENEYPYRQILIKLSEIYNLKLIANEK